MLPAKAGYISGSNIQDITIGSSTSSVTAIANWGYHFVEWSDNHSTNPVRSDVGRYNSYLHSNLFRWI